MSDPVFVLLHGAWHSPRYWDSLISALSKHGYSAIAPRLPSSGSKPPTPDWSADVEVIRKTVTTLVQDHDVVVVTHSFSGMTGGTALEGLDKQACRSNGLKGGVIRLICINAFLVPEGFQHSPRGTSDNMIPEMKIDLNAFICCIVGGKALLYYGVHGILTYEPGPKILLQIKSLLHTYPRFKQKGVKISFYIMPASEYFVTDLEEAMIERSRNNVPYPKLEVFAQSLVSTQRWSELAQLVDGMDLDEEWGYTHLYLNKPSEAETQYVLAKNRKMKSSCDGFPGTDA